MLTRKVSRCVYASLALSLSLLCFLGRVPASADTEIKRVTDILAVTALNEVDSTSTPKASPFALRFDQRVTYEGLTIPEGTVLQGLITDIRPSKRWGRPARFTVLISDVLLPSGARHHLTGEDNTRQLIFRENYRKTAGGLLGRQALIGLTSLAISVPVTLLADLDGWGLVAVDNTIDAIIGASQEVTLKDPFDTRSTGQKIATGAFRGVSALPTLVSLARKRPNLSYQPNQTIPLRLTPAFWSQLTPVLK